MADKFFHEFPTATTLKDTSILLLDQDNQTTAITLAQLKSFLGFISGGNTNPNVNNPTVVTNPTVGNADAGIFVSAVCYINGATGLWTAPTGCNSARVTVVGGGGSSSGQGGTNGTRSYFNYPNGATPSTNQLFADGGVFGYGDRSSTNGGGNAGWNGIVVNGGFGGAGPSFGKLSSGKGGEGRMGNKGGGGGGGGAASPGGQNDGGVVTYTYKGGSSGGINGSGQEGGSPDNSGGSYISGSTGGGIIQLSNIATSLPNYNAAITNKVGKGGVPDPRFIGSYTGGSGGGWCTAVVSVTPGTSYAYAAGIGGAIGSGNFPAKGGSYGMVVIEW